MWKLLRLLTEKPDALLVVGVLLAVSAAGNRLLGGPDTLVGAFGLLAAGCFGVAITQAALQHERDESR